MALPFNDPFTVGVNTDLQNHTNWAQIKNDLEIRTATDDVRGKANGTGYACAYNDSETYGDDHYAQGTMNSVVTTTDWVGPAIRCGLGGGTNFYAYWGRDTDSELVKEVTGTKTVIGSGGQGWAVSDDVYLEANGTTLDPKINGTTDTNIGQVTDSSLTAGSAGLAALDNSASNRIDDFVGDDLAGGAYTLTAAQGSYSLTGQAALLLAQRKIAAAQGAYALTGQAAELEKGYTMPAAQGAYTLTGQAAELLMGFNLVAAQGAYTLTGQAAELLMGFNLAAAQGAYALTGQAANLIYTPVGGYTLVADQGAYTLTGQAALLLAQRVLTAEQGAYALTGQAAALLAARVLTAGQGSYTLTGQAALLLMGYAILAAQGAYALTGQDAQLIPFEVATIDWTLRPRSLAWTLSDRDLSFDNYKAYIVGELKKRSFDWTLYTRE